MAKKILIVDDNKDILDIVHETLSYENFEVLATSENHGIIEKVTGFNPDLIIIDYRLGNINGGEICQQIKQLPGFENLPVIIFSAYVNKPEDLFDYGCNAVIDKPFDLTELIDKVNNLVN
ncbi:response regulator [Mucilaginibacter sp. KACC 22063]|uniref:response regulator n=1 Tax=Mucilaginibacter sp. KACC 22063 TaxID=3025666 RepID=UPI002365EF7D|nr:response regulator [Mucilaginibacter sp. KACC 22063]WDF54505.1 response regulator [Mucilaginibacter sp. KACC 22063]